MKRALLFLIVAIAAPLCAADRATGYVAGGYIYNLRERDSGGWIELGASRGRFALSLGASQFADEFQFREIELLAHARVAEHFTVHGGYAVGSFCAPGQC